MAKFYQDVRNIFEDVDDFLDSVKDAKLPKSAVAKRAKVKAQIDSLRQDYPQLNAQGADASPKANDDDVDDCLYEDTEAVTESIAPDKKPPKGENGGGAQDVTKIDVPANGGALNIKMCGIMAKRKEKKSLLSKLKKGYCVLRKNLLYVYENKTSKKQKECIIVDGYEVREMEELVAKKEYVFEMACAGKKTHVFETANEADMKEWIQVLGEMAGTLITDPAVDQVGYYAEADDEMQAGSRISEVLYEDTSDMDLPSRPKLSSHESPEMPTKASHGAMVSRPVPPPPSSRVTPPPGPRSSPPPPEEIYDDTDPKAPTPPPPAAEPPEEIYDDTLGEQEDEIYDDTAQGGPEEDEDAPPSLPSRLGGGGGKPPPPPPRGVDATPDVPVRSNGGATPPGEPRASLTNGAPPGAERDIYGQMYYGVWDCSADHGKELSFRRGDLIHVVSRKYEDKGWWVARLNGRVGLVPRKYLAQAYERL